MALVILMLNLWVASCQGTRMVILSGTARPWNKYLFGQIHIYQGFVANDGKYDNIDRSDEDIIQRGGMSKINYTALVQCNDSTADLILNPGQYGIKCGDLCITVTGWCLVGTGCYCLVVVLLPSKF